MKVEEHAMWVFVPFMLPYRRPFRRCQPMRCLLRLMISAASSVGPLSFLSLDSHYRMFQGNHPLRRLSTSSLLSLYCWR